ncbi:MAG: hypothetical protein KC944_09535, partial [Candidatus Omnitrophica bacterium]|nr:hypothetical protein [Candidatus Omnitrophota bacterium]
RTTTRSPRRESRRYRKRFKRSNVSSKNETPLDAISGGVFVFVLGPVRRCCWNVSLARFSSHRIPIRWGALTPD